MGDIIDFKAKKEKKSFNKLEYEIGILRSDMRQSLNDGFSKRSIFETGIGIFENMGVTSDDAFDIVITLMGEII